MLYDMTKVLETLDNAAKRNLANAFEEFIAKISAWRGINGNHVLMDCEGVALLRLSLPVEADFLEFTILQAEDQLREIVYSIDIPEIGDNENNS